VKYVGETVIGAGDWVGIALTTPGMNIFAFAFCALID